MTFRRSSMFPGAICLLALTVSLGCRPQPDAAGHADEAQHNHDHESESASARITAWSDRHEVFVEHPAPVAGAPATLLAHVTRLSDWKPRSDGPVTFHLRQGPTSQDHLQATPAKPGIYQPRLTFPQPGDWQVSLSIPDGDARDTVELGTIRVFPNPHAAEHPEYPEPPGGIAFLKEQQWKVAFRIESAARTALTQRIQVPAHVRLVPGRGAQGMAPLAGRLETVPGGTAPRPGQTVTAGQPLAILRPVFSETSARLAESEAEFAIAKASLEQAETTLTRVRRLAADQAKSARELQEAELNLATARARLNASARLLDSLRPGADAAGDHQPFRIPLTAPIDGILESVSAGPGETVTAGQAVFRVIDPSLVWVEARVPESRTSRLKTAGDALLEVPEAPGRFAPGGSEGWLRPITLGREVDPETRTIPLVYEIPNADGRLRPGQWVNLAVAVAGTTNALALPDSAIVEESGHPVAFVQLDGETFEKRELTLGMRDGDRIEVLSGIAVGERVVTVGAYAVRLSSLSASLPSHGHAH